MLIKFSNSLEVLPALDTGVGMLLCLVLISSPDVWETFVAFDTMKLMSLRGLIDNREWDGADLAPADVLGELVAGQLVSGFESDGAL